MEYRAVTVEPNSYEVLRGVPQSARDGSGGSRILALLKAFCTLMVVVITFMTLMSGLFLLAESDDDMRGEASGRYNNAVEAWNTQNRANFATAAPFKVGPDELETDLSATAAPLIRKYDSDPDELLVSDPLHYSSTISFGGDTLDPNEWSPTDPDLPLVEVDLTVSGQDAEKVVLPRRFTEQVCKWVQRGKWNRQVCDWHYYVLSGVCVKMGQQADSDKWQPSFDIEGVRGQTAGVGCYMYGSPSANMHDYRGLYLWSAGIYTSAKYRLETPNTIPVEIRADTDPELLVDMLTAGTYAFGPTQAVKFFWGTIMTVTSSAVLCSFCFCVFLQYSWPQAASNNDRVKYFYRRYLRKPHNWIKASWSSMTGSTREEPEPEEEESSTWTGPTGPGNKLGQAPPSIYDPMGNPARDQWV